VSVGRRVQIVAFLRNVVAGFDASSGRLLWQHEWSKGYDEHSSWPVYREPLLLTCSPFRLGARCLRLKSDAQGGGVELAWKTGAMSNDVMSSILVGDCIYGFDLLDQQPPGSKPARGSFKCIGIEDGNVCWSTDATGHASVLAADGKLFLLNESGEVILARATPERYDELARARVIKSGLCWTPPTLHRGRLYLRNHREAVCVFVGAGAPPAAATGAEGASAVRETTWAEAWRERVRAPSGIVPEWGDLLLWYGVNLMLVAGGAAVSLGFYAMFTRLRLSAPLWRARALFLFWCFVAGATGTLVLSIRPGRLLFTWPLALFVSCVPALAAADGAGTRPRGRLISFAATAFFLATCAAYYVASRRLFILTGFGFYVGLLPAAPVMLLALRLMKRKQRPRTDIFWMSLSFTLFFWTAALFTYWRTRL